MQPPPSLPGSASPGVFAVLRRVPSTCLERALVLQCWLASHGIERDVIVGVVREPEFAAHAWLDGEDDGTDYHELTRLPAVPGE